MFPAVLSWNIPPVPHYPTGKQIPRVHLPRLSFLSRMCVWLILFSFFSPPAFGVLEDCHDAASGVRNLFCFVLFSAISPYFYLFCSHHFFSPSCSSLQYSAYHEAIKKKTICQGSVLGTWLVFPAFWLVKFAFFDYLNPRKFLKWIRLSATSIISLPGF